MCDMLGTLHGEQQANHNLCLFRFNPFVNRPPVGEVCAFLVKPCCRDVNLWCAIVKRWLPIAEIGTYALRFKARLRPTAQPTRLR